ncbi:nuclease-related domain-containing protein [Cytobacillus sp.]|uniref:nuclease-related domain-containing protein n=1 Tax=Cytobacillus sp. TaxID=2675269 RepID=UPI0035184B3F
MILKFRYEPVELKMLRFLNGRLRLSPKDYSHFHNLEKGFSSEKIFDQLLEELPEEWIILHDLLFDYSNTFFQIDSLLITGDCIYIFEVKDNAETFISNKTDGTPHHQILKLKTLFCSCSEVNLS